jgi:transcriptional regulator with XRE-family HTH domain
VCAVNILGARLRTLRRSLGKTLKEVERDTGISWSTLGMYERGKRKPSLPRLRILAEYYRVAADELLDIAATEEEGLRRLLDNPNVSLAARKIGSMPEWKQRQVLRLIEVMESEAKDRRGNRGD